MGLSMTFRLPRVASKESRRLNFKRYSPLHKRTNALLSIKPEFADAIFRGEKRYEFRRSVFQRPVQVVVVYITSPICHVAGEFDVVEVISDTVEHLWFRTHAQAGIDRDRFLKYFAGCRKGYAIAIGNVRQYPNPLDLHTSFGVKPPQSFVYV